MFLIIFRKVNVSLEQLELWRRKLVDISLSWPQLQTRLSKSRKPCLNLFSQRWLIPSLSLVSNLTHFGLWHLKTVSRRMYESQKLFLEDTQFSELHIFWYKLVPLNNYRKEKRISEKIMFYFELKNVISISCVVWSHRSRNNTKWIFWRLVSEYF